MYKESKEVNKVVKNVYCNNCGNEGHLYRHCRLPVLSFGVLCIEGEKILMIQRKDSLSYIEFLRGKYDTHNVKYLVKLFNGCSLKERENIKNMDFDELWQSLWLTDDNSEQTDRMLREYKNSKENFEKLKLTNINELLDKCTTNYMTPEWEFPKGRRNPYETNLKCAIREFEEETNLTSEDYTLLDNVSPLEEEYVGSNGVRYKHIYYVAFYNVVKELDGVKGHGCVKELDGVKGHGCVKELSINLEKYEQFSEIADIAWLTIDEGFDKIRKEQTTKKGILEQIKKFNDMWTNDFNFKE